MKNILSHTDNTETLDNSFGSDTLRDIDAAAGEEASGKMKKAITSLKDEELRNSIREKLGMSDGKATDASAPNSRLGVRNIVIIMHHEHSIK